MGNNRMAADWAQTGKYDPIVKDGLVLYAPLGCHMEKAWVYA